MARVETVRIIGGRFKGIKLVSPKGDSVRPTLDRVREAFFNIIGFAVEGATFLDLYGGSGAVGLEALSRGAKHVTVVELWQTGLIQQNCAKCQVAPSDEFRLIKGEVMATMAELTSAETRFDIVYADPPWKTGAPDGLIGYGAQILNEGGQFILESFHKDAAPSEPGSLNLAGTRKYGDAALHFYTR
ncbi:16S rRNA (guanine(966)-N(2))-methyltransferase [hydrothermal vent metagenome]|uniref:16S rRNA (Guanine(966)-N(2))-methyltransferase n=1 Tax=hydrothermal vent metagenome TaxID=652676 RepID=A0A3B1BRS9_9ZZZZ